MLNLRCSSTHGFTKSQQCYSSSCHSTSTQGTQITALDDTVLMLHYWVKLLFVITVIVSNGWCGVAWTHLLQIFPHWPPLYAIEWSNVLQHVVIEAFINSLPSELKSSGLENRASLHKMKWWVMFGSERVGGENVACWCSNQQAGALKWKWVKKKGGCVCTGDFAQPRGLYVCLSSDSLFLLFPREEQQK